MKTVPMKHSPVNVTDEQRKNLERLADFLELLDMNQPIPTKFDMAFYIEGDEDSEEPWLDDADFLCMRPSEVMYRCGTVACAIGHGPAAGIEALPDETWSDYIDRAFIDNPPEAFTFMFGPEWKDLDNTPSGAAKRIRYTLQHGLPANWENQMNGDHPICY